MKGNYAYLSSGYGIDILDLSQPQQPRRAGNLFTRQTPNWICVAGESALVAESDRLEIFDVSHPAHPVLLADQEIQGGARRVEVSGNYAFVVPNCEAPIEVFDISAPERPLRVGYSQKAYYASAVHVVGNKVFVAAGLSGLRILEIKPNQLLAAPVFTGSSVVLSWAGGPGVWLQRSVGLNPPNWMDVSGSAGQSRLELPLTNSTGFFRLISR